MQVAPPVGQTNTSGANFLTIASGATWLSNFQPIVTEVKIVKELKTVKKVKIVKELKSVKKVKIVKEVKTVTEMKIVKEVKIV